MLRKINTNDNVIKILSSIINNSNTQDIDSGLTKEDFLNQKLPTVNIDKEEDNHFVSIINSKDIKLSACAKLLNCVECTNAIMYYSNSFMKWHTNSDNPGKRIYYTYTVGESCFRYIDKNGNDIIDYDNVGWTAREFRVPEQGYLWHTIWTNKKRYAFGFNQR
jgi:hypothetical protein